MTKRRDEDMLPDCFSGELPLDRLEEARRLTAAEDEQ